MDGFPSHFSSFFYKHFPQWRNHINQEQQHAIMMLAQDITNHQNCETIWKVLEENPFLLGYFNQQSQKLLTTDRKIHPELMIFCWMISVMGGLSLLVYFREHIPAEIMNIISAILGIFATHLKSTCQQHLGRKVSYQ